MAQRSNYQDRIIRNYYRNRDELMVQKLGELVADLYLAEGKKRKTVWARAEAALRNLKVPEKEIAHLVKSDNPTLLANKVQELLKKEQS